MAMRQPEDEVADLQSSGLRRALRCVESLDGTRLTVGGRSIHNFSSNDYLGLSRHPLLAEAAARALAEFGTGSGASRLICGSLAPHHRLEELIASIKGTESALAFSSGYAAAVGTTSALVGKGDTIILDKLCHASLVDGARLSGATIRVFPHNHLAKLERLLASAHRKAAPDGRILVVTESVFSMDGDQAPLGEIVELKDRFEALLLVDEAHAIGVLGPTGQGLAEQLGIQDRIDLQLGTLGKAVGAGGGYIAARGALIELLVNKARSFIYSTAPPPAQVASAAAGLELIASPDGGVLRGNLWRNLQRFAHLTGFPEPTSAIVPVLIGDNEAALAAAEALLEAGFLIPAIRYPTVPRNTARLRITLSASHEASQVESLAQALGELGFSATKRE